MNLVISDERIIARYDLFFDLKELDWDHYKKKYDNTYLMDWILKAEGIHSGVMAGTVLWVLQTYAGLHLQGDIVRINPKLPQHW